MRDCTSDNPITADTPWVSTGQWQAFPPAILQSTLASLPFTLLSLLCKNKGYQGGRWYIRVVPKHPLGTASHSTFPACTQHRHQHSSPNHFHTNYLSVAVGKAENIGRMAASFPLIILENVCHKSLKGKKKKKRSGIFPSAMQKISCDSAWKSSWILPSSHYRSAQISRCETKSPPARCSANA